MYNIDQRGETPCFSSDLGSPKENSRKNERNEKLEKTKQNERDLLEKSKKLNALVSDEQKVYFVISPIKSLIMIRCATDLKDFENPQGKTSTK